MKEPSTCFMARYKNIYSKSKTKAKIFTLTTWWIVVTNCGTTEQSATSVASTTVYTTIPMY